MSVENTEKPAGERIQRAIPEKNLGREAVTQVNHFILCIPCTHQAALKMFWLGFTLSVIGSFIGAAGAVLALSGGAR